MNSSSDKYSKKGLQTSYVSTVIGISLVLFMIGLVIGGFFALENLQNQAKESVQGDLFFKAEQSEYDIKQIEQVLKTWSEFKEVQFISPERAVDEFSGGDRDSKEILAIFEGENPLPATILFRPKSNYASLEGMEAIKAKILKAFPNEIDEVNYDKSAVDSVNLGFKQFVFLFLAIASLLIVVAVAMINNTIRMALYAKRFTIKTMQLVGATSFYIRKPFLWQSVVQGLISAVIGFSLVMTLLFALNNLLNSFEVTFDLFIFVFLLAALIFIGIFISLVSTWFALNKYLKMKLDDLY